MKKTLCLLMLALMYLTSAVNAQNIIFVQGTNPSTSHDSVQIAWLEDAGYTVTIFFPDGGLSTASQATLNWLNSADLVILGRSVPSTTFQPPNRAYWNAIKAPVLQCSGWATRNSRANWFDSGTADNYSAPDTVWADVLVPGDPVFSGVTLVGDSLDWMVAAHSAVSVPSTTATNADIIVRSQTYGRSDSNYVLLARFEPYVEFYPGSGDYPAGYYTYFGFGNDQGGIINTFPLTDNARTVYLAEIERLLALPEPAKHIMFVEGLDNANSNDSAQVAWLRSEGFEVTVIWPSDNIDEDTLAILNRADLVILGRSVPSTTFQPPYRKLWNSIKAPVLQCSGWGIRNSRANWFNSGTASNYSTPDTAWANILMPGDDIFTGAPLVGDSLDWMVAAHSAISVPSNVETNAEILARGVGADSNYVLIARFEPFVEFYPGAGDYPAGYYSYFGFGNDQGGIINTFPLTDNAKAIYLAEINRLMATPEPPANIMYIEGLENANSNDSAQVAWLRDQGYNVMVLWPHDNLGPDTLALLNTADLVILGRSVPSTTFQPPYRAYWNAIKAPVIQCSGWGIRNSRANWFDSGTADNYSAPDTVWADVLVPGDDVFAGVTLVGDSLDWMIAAHSAISVPSTTQTNADIIARSQTYGRSDSNYVLLARFEPLVEFYTDAGDYPSGRYTYFGFGNDQGGVINTFPLTDNAKVVYKAEIDRQLMAPMAPLSGDADLTSLAATVGTLDPAFDPAVLAYTLTVATGSVDTLTATAHPNATVAGDGEVAVPSVATITVTADDGTTQDYVITVEGGLGTDATLSDLQVDGTTIDGFDPGTTDYDYIVDGTDVPTVTATATDANANVDITPATAVPGSTTVLVTAQDGTTTLTYTVNFTPNAIDNITIDELGIYPNPAMNRITISNVNNVNFIAIYNLAGDVVLDMNIENVNGIANVNISELPAGFYLIRAYENENLMAIGKFTKQ